LVKKVYELKEISFIQRAFRREYPTRKIGHACFYKHVLHACPILRGMTALQIIL
jgi:hypothetical protein